MSRQPQAVLAGVCAWIAGRLGWNVWGLRIALLILAWLKPITVVLAYVIAGLVLRHYGNRPVQQRRTGARRIVDHGRDAEYESVHDDRVREVMRRYDAQDF